MATTPISTGERRRQLQAVARVSPGDTLPHVALSDEAGILSPPPLCVRSNSVLYKGNILLPSDFYNVSLEANPNTGTPYGFFHEPLPGGAGGLEGREVGFG